MIIYDNTGSILLDIEVDDTSVRYKAIKGENSLTLKFSLAEHIEIPLGAYAVFKGERYSLMLPEDFTMHHRRNFEYSLVMYSEDYKARLYKFINPVDSRLKFSLTAKPIEHLQMFVDNMNMRDSGWAVGECPDHVEIVLSYNHTYCHDALVQLVDKLKLDYWYNGKTVNLGKLEFNKDKPLPLSYGGDGEGLNPNIKRTNYSDSLPMEVLYVQGSSTNIDPSKYRVNDKPVSELHLPLSKTIGFDGTYFDHEDRYDATKARQYKTDENGYSIRRADREVVNHSEDSLDCSEIEPTKTETVVSVIEVNKEKHFYDIFFESSVDYSKYIIEGENATVVFQSGMLAGKEFDLATDENGNLVCKQEGGKWRVEIVPQDIDGITMPDKDSGYLPVAGDTFKVFGIQLPDEYVSEAEIEMLRYAVKHMYANEDPQYTIAGELDEIYAKRNWDTIKDKLSLGNYISFSDKSFQTEPLLIRIIGIKEYVNKPYSPQLEISNAALSGTLVGTLNRIENQEVQTEDMFREAIGFTKRRWRDTKETISMLQGAIDGFSEGINPITVETMTMLVGDERLQFVLTDSLTSDGHADLHYEYDAATGTFSVESAYIKHMTLGIDSISPVHTEDEYKRWSVSGKSEVLESESGYYLYAKVSKSNATGSFELLKSTMADDDEWYFLLVGIINSEYGGDRSFASMYGYSEVRPGQITTDNIRSSDGKTWLDLLKGILYLNDMAGVSGVKETTKGDKSIAAWFGGLMKDKELDDDKENAAKSVIRHDGTGYFADGLFRWNKDQGLNLGNGQLKINYDGSVDFGGNIRIGSTGEETLDSLLTIVAKLTDMWRLDKDGNIITDYNVIIGGDVASGGTGQNTPAAGTVTGVTVSGVDYTSIEAGLLDLTELMAKYTPFASHNSLASRVTTLEGKATAVSFSQTLTSGTQIGVLTIDGSSKALYAPTIPTSDINKGVTAYGWGNHANAGYQLSSGLGSFAYKSSLVASDIPSLDWSKITSGKPTTLAGYGITDALKTDGSNVMTAAIRWNAGADGNDVADWNTVATETGLRIISSVTTTSNAPTTYSTALHVRGRYGFQIASEGGSANKFWIRNIRDVGKWNQIAFMDSNVASANTIFINYSRTNTDYDIVFTTQRAEWSAGVAPVYISDQPDRGLTYNPSTGTLTALNFAGIATSATKLQTPRTIWGQSFDGTGNVDGDLHLRAADIYWHSDKNNYCIESVVTSTSPYLKVAHYGGIEFHTGPQARMRINTSGNVTIGGIDEATTKCKLFVAGSTVVQSLKSTTQHPTLGNAAGGGHLIVGNLNLGLELWTRSDGHSALQAHRTDGVAEAFNLLIQPLGGNVGIGTTTPSARLDVESTLRVFNLANDVCFHVSSIASNVIRLAVHNMAMSAWHAMSLGYNNQLYLNTASIRNNYVGVNTNNPLYQLDVAGTGRFTGALTLDSTLTTHGKFTASAGADITGNTTINGDLRVNGNVVITGDSASGGTGQNTPSDGEDDGTGDSVTTVTAEWYNIKTRLNQKANSADIVPITVIENYRDVLTDSSKYRMVLMRFRSGGKLYQYGKSWKVPMFSSRWNKGTGEIVKESVESAIPWGYTWWPISGTHQSWWGDGLNISDVINVSWVRRGGMSTQHYVFSNSKTTRQRIGCAIYKKMDDGMWQRVSNIAQVQLRLQQDTNITVQVVE